MSIPIEPTVPKSTGIRCPVKLYQQFINRDVVSDFCAITEANKSFIIFQETTEPTINEDSIGGRYTYTTGWSPHMITRNDLPERKQILFDLIVTNTKHWGLPAEMALEMLATTVG